ncbi:uncharacterized protein [Pyxicephalus adspersus]|uniref:uncharacterized protein n=1 Tax=Pyxicephalus adspersus TaxID=30357 RepID=UPI003B5C1EAC
MSYPLTPLTLLLWGTIFSIEPSGTILNYCLDQPREIESFVGDTVTLPCKFTYPEKKETVSDVAIIWKAHDVPYCGKTEDEIYSSKTNVSFSKYPGRLLLQGDPIDKNVSLILNNAIPNDRNRYCCRVIISYKDKKKVEFQSPDGTNLIVRGEQELKLDQPYFIPALYGDTVTLLCRISSMKNIIPPFNSCRLWRSTGKNPACDKLVHSGDCSDRFRENILYYKIYQTLSSHQGWYCWEIRDTNTQKTYKKAFGTQLVIVGRTNDIKVIQPQEIVSTFQRNLVISCSFTKPFINSVSEEVYWMIGDPREDYVYHPNLDFINSDYKGRTRLVDGSNLLLQDVHGLNNTIFYCRVMIQHCGSFANKTEVIMGEGPGTLLRIYNVTGPPESGTTLSLCPQSLILLVCVALKFILLLSLFILALVHIKLMTSNSQSR